MSRNFLRVRKNYAMSGKSFVCPEKKFAFFSPPPTQKILISDGNVVGKSDTTPPPPFSYPLRYGIGCCSKVKDLSNEFRKLYIYNIVYAGTQVI